MPSLQTFLKALRELGPTQVGLLALYRLGLKTGHYRRVINPPKDETVTLNQALFPIPSREALLAALGEGGLAELRARADEISGGRYRQFGGDPVAIRLDPPSRAHWAELEARPHRLADIKLAWEPARFGWVFTLGRAWLATGNARYPAAFWNFFESFQAKNPPYYGENWTSAQEVALRLMALAWSGQVFANAEQTTPARLAALSVSVAAHAARIPPTLLYARAQNNNHLLTEAAGLYTAGLALPGHSQAPAWKKLGRKWLAWCFHHQIDSTGEYIQHSANYHRLMLQTALWVHALPGQAERLFDARARENLALAAHWLFCLLDEASGGVPNLGPNDGAYLFPMTNLPIEDYRPVVQAAARAFLGYSLPAGPWDELPLWFETQPKKLKVDGATPADLRLLGLYPTTLQPAGHTWAYLRTARLRSRPGHADLLHLDLWWRGHNISLDPGTVSYNDPPPWDNPLTAAWFHNTVTVDGRDQFTRAGRFLYLDRADAVRLKTGQEGVTARHYAYASLHVRHTRAVSAPSPDHWQVQDELLNLRLRPHTFRLHWLLPDWEYELESGQDGVNLHLHSPLGLICLRVTTHPAPGSLASAVSLVRAGDPDPLRGWFSPTYGHKLPALSLAIEVQSADNVQFTSEFIFPSIRTD
jgi:hypothetical protein